MIVEAREAGSNELHYFDLNFAPASGSVHLFSWMDGTRKQMTVTPVADLPDRSEVVPAALDIASREIVVQTGR